MLTFDRVTSAGSDRIAVEIHTLVIAGWAGRDEAAIRHHIEELAAIGVPRPSSVPVYYRVSADNLTQAERLVVLGPDSSGEVEPVVISLADGLWLGLGSDHTDRGLERDSVTHAKQVSPKVVCPELWRYSDVQDHWDQLVLRSFSGEGRRLYQEGPVTAMLDPLEILERVERRTGRGVDDTLVFSGTLGLAGELEHADRFACELEDRQTGNTLALDYTVTVVDPLD
jgi:hypothetical protein